MDWLSPMREVFGFTSPLFEPLPIIRAILGFILMFFLPGFAWTLVFFRQINTLERVVLSIGLSIAMVTLGILSLNRLIGVRITMLSSVITIMLITIIPIVFYYLNRFIRQRKLF